MSRRSVVLGAALTLTALTAAAALVSPAASAQSFTHEHFTAAIDPKPYDSDGTPTSDSGTVKVVADANVRGSSPFPYFREHFNGTVVTTNLDTGGTFTNRFVGNNHDHITDNGDGTITITSYASGSSKYYDQNGTFVLKDPVRSGSPSTLTTTTPPATPRTTPTCRTPSGSSAPRPATPTSRPATSATTWSPSPRPDPFLWCLSAYHRGTVDLTVFPARRAEQ